jgi:hypothetical protein
MNIDKLRNVVKEIESLKYFGASDATLTKTLVEFLYNETNGQLQSYFMMIDDIRKEQLREERNLIMHGLEDAMHAMSHLSGKIDEKDMKALINVNKIYFDSADGNIAFIINIAKAYFPDGTYGHAAQSGVEFFNKFRALLRKHKDQYLTGSSMDWAKRLGHYDYIKLVLEKDSENNKL